MRILASGLLLIGAFWTGVGCGNQSRSVQGNIEVAGENTQDTGIVGNGVTNDAGDAAGHSAQAGSTDSSETAEAGVSQNTAAGSTVMVSGGITEQKAKEIATVNDLQIFICHFHCNFVYDPAALAFLFLHL